jgi:hypothetical protein
MTFVPHLRLAWGGSLGTSGEIWSNSLALEPHTGTWQSVVTGGLQLAALTAYLVDFQSTSWEDMHADVAAFCTDAGVRGTALSRLKYVKLAAIGADGRYAGAPLEAAYDVPMGVPDDAYQPPYQIARKVTLETDGDLGRIKGGFFLPAPQLASGFGFDAPSDLWDVTTTESVRDHVVTFLNNLANEPGLDDQDLRPCVASQGRHNKNGTVRVGPSNPEVVRVNVGRRPDVIRRRANKRTEARLADASVSF